MKLTGIELAELCKLRRQAIYKYARENRLKKDDNKLYDTDEKINSEFLLKHGKTKKDVENYVRNKVEKKKGRPKKTDVKSIKKPIKKQPVKKKQVKVVKKTKPKKDEKPTKEEEEEFENITGLPTKMMNLNLNQLVRRYGGPMMLKNWVDILNKLMQANERDQKIQMKALDLIEKNFVISRLFSYIEVLHNQIFNLSKSNVDHIIAVSIAKKSKARTEIEKLLTKEFERLIKDAKSNIDKELDALKNKFDKVREDDE